MLVPDEEMRQAIAEGRDFMARRTPWPTNCQTLPEHIERLRAEGEISDETAGRALEEWRPKAVGIA